MITDGWTYDANGNRMTQTGTNASTFSVSSSSNRLTGVSGALGRTYSYTLAGMVSGDGTNTFTYNDRGRMLSAANSGGTTNYLYSALGVLIQKATSSPTNLYVYDEAGQLLGEYDGSGNLIEETLWLGRIPVATLRPDPVSGVDIYYVHTDHLKTPKKVSRPSDNALVWRIDQDPFGTAAANQNPSGIGTFAYNLRFPGQLYMSETGLNQNWNRDYDPLIGKYIESDRIGLKGGINTYAYVGSKPLIRVDRRGLQAEALPDPPEPSECTAWYCKLCRTVKCGTECTPSDPLAGWPCGTHCAYFHVYAQPAHPGEGPFNSDGFVGDAATTPGCVCTRAAQ